MITLNKRLSAFTVFVLCAILTPGVLWAFPVKDVRLAYSIEDKKLTVEIDFVVRDRQKDFIRKVTVQQNGKEVIANTYSFQKEFGKFVEEFSLDAKPGDEFVVEAFASRGGNNSATLRVEQPEEKKDENAANLSTDTIQPSESPDGN